MGLSVFLASTLRISALSAPLTIQERAGIARDQDYAVFGVPVPASWVVTRPELLVLRDATTAPVTAQFDILTRWISGAGNETAAAKWILITVPQSIAAGAIAMMSLEKNTAALPSLPNLPVRVVGDLLEIDTGAAIFALNRQAFTLFDQVTVAGRSILQPLGTSDAAVFRGIEGVDVVAPTVNHQRRNYSLRVERHGPLSVIVKAVGSLCNERAEPILDFTVRYHFFAGQAEARIDFTVENNYPVIVGEGDQPANVHNQGATNSVYVGALQLAVQVASTDSPLRVLMEPAVDLIAPDEEIRLIQTGSGTPHWNAYVGLVGWDTNIDCAPRLQSHSPASGFTVNGAGISATGQQALGWASVSRTGINGARVQVAVRDFWQNFPKAIRTTAEGKLVVDLFPDGRQFRHNLRVGEEKTHTLWYRFGSGTQTNEPIVRWARARNMPLVGHAAPDWIASTKALGECPPQDLARWPMYERYVRTAFEPNPDFDPDVDDPSFGNRTLCEVIADYNFFGWQDYGDVPLDYEAFGPNQAGQMNLKYWYLYGMCLQYARSGDAGWLDLAGAAAWHLADIDYLHIPDEGVQHWVHGAYFGHSNHDEPGNFNPNRNSNSPSVDLFFGVPDLFLAYYLTGELRFREVALEGLEAMANESQFSDFTNPVPYRERANSITAYLEGYRYTGDVRWLEALRKIVGETANLSNKAWLTNPNTYRSGDDWSWLSSFQLSQVGWSLGRYLDFCSEIRIADDLNVTNALLGYANFIQKHFMNEYRPGRAACWNAFYFYEPHEEPYLEIDNWALVTADVLAYAYKYSGNTNYLNTASKFYATGTIDPVWENDPPVFLGTKDLVNALNWGLVYMNQTSKTALPPLQPPRLTLQMTPSHVRLQWDDFGQHCRYAVESAEALPATLWTVLSGATLLNTNVWLDQRPTGHQRFWRVRVEPRADW
jgi:hypothetical protein